MQVLRLFLITVAHFCVDSYATLLAPILPQIIDKFDLTLAQAGLLGTIVSICNLSQPLLGIWADRMTRRYLVPAGLLFAALCSPLLGIAPNYTVLVLVLTLGGFGVAAFHPQVFSLAGDLSGDRRSFGLALFIFGGTLGIGLTPMWVPYYVSQIGLSYLPLVSVPGLIFVGLILYGAPLDNPNPQTGRAALLQNLGPQAWPLFLITSVVILRSVSGLGFGLYLTVLARDRGLSAIAGGMELGIYNIAGVVGALFAGYLADRTKNKPFVWGSLLLSVPALYAYIQAQDWTSYPLLVIGGGALMASNSILVAMAQELAPKNSGLASSLPLGFSWGLASLTLPFIGHLADRIGVAPTLEYLALLPLLTALLAFFLPSGDHKTPRPAT